MLFKDCKHFSGDKPCTYHKEENIKCDTCNHYVPIDNKVLIIKLDAIGDVLRTTSILKPLKLKYPDSHITWCTRENAKSILSGNKFVDDIIIIDEDAFFRLQVEKFKIVINLDTSKFSSAIAASARGKNKIGFVLNENGNVIPTSEAANKWLMMSAFDDVKKENKKSYQQLMYDIIKINDSVEPPYIYSSEKIRNEKLEELKKSGLDPKKITIGLNIGVGTKWPSKSWPISNWEALIKLMINENYNVILLGGNDEKTALDILSGNYNYVINSGGENTVDEFSAIVDLCDIVVTADTFALHVATALKKSILALFGPTSLNEVELYEKGIKLHAQDGCECYYKKNCLQSVSCMQKISAEQVYSALKSLIEGGRY